MTECPINACSPKHHSGGDERSFGSGSAGSGLAKGECVRMNGLIMNMCLGLCQLAAPADLYEPVTIEIEPEQVTAKTPLPRVQCWLVCRADCPPCERMKLQIQQQLVPLGWKYGSNAACDIRLVDTKTAEACLNDQPAITSWPTCILLVDGQPRVRLVGYLSPGKLSQQINQWRLANPPK